MRKVVQKIAADGYWSYQPDIPVHWAINFGKAYV